MDAELLVAHVLGWSRASLRTAAQEPVPAALVPELEAAAARRAAREPLQLILGEVGFRYLDVIVRPGVFIPRPETEVLAGLAIERTPSGGIVVEPCTGTGAVACAVATEARPSMVVATDISAAAVALARDNARRNAAAVMVLCGDLLAPLGEELRGAVDVVVCNPPYVAAGEMAGLQPELAWDPIEALVSGPTGDEVVDRLIAAAPQWLRGGGWLLLEVDEQRAQPTAQRLTAAGFAQVRVIADLAGRDRIVEARRTPDKEQR